MTGSRTKEGRCPVAKALPKALAATATDADGALVVLGQQIKTVTEKQRSTKFGDDCNSSTFSSEKNNSL